MEMLNSFTEGSATATLFLTVGILATIVLIFTFVLDGILEAFDIGDGPLSISVMSSFVALFGFVSFAAITAYDTSVLTAVIAGAIAGLLAGVFAFMVTQFLRNSEHSDSAGVSEFIGRKGKLTYGIRAKDNGTMSYGEVSLYLRGNKYVFSATAEEEIPKDTEVEIAEQRSDTLMLVKPVATSETSETNNNVTN